MAWDEDWLTADLERFRDGRGPEDWERWRALATRVLGRRGAGPQDIEDATSDAIKLLMYGRRRTRTRDHGAPLCKQALARPQADRAGWACKLVLHEWLRRQRWSEGRRALRQLVSKVLSEARRLPTPEAPPTMLRRSGRFDREAVTLAVAWLLGQAGAVTARPSQLAAELLELWRAEFEFTGEGDEVPQAAQVALAIDADRVAERILPLLDNHARLLLGLRGRGLGLREVAGCLGCGLATASRHLAEVTHRLIEAADHDREIAALALGYLQARCAGQDHH